MKKHYFLIYLLFALVFALAGCGQLPADAPHTDSGLSAGTAAVSGEEKPADSGILTVHYIDVGQADAILLQQDESAMLIDAGENGSGKDVVAFIKEQDITRLDYVIGTHPHSDHIGGLDDVIDAFEIGQVIMPQVSHTTKTYEDVLLSIRNKGLTVTGARAGQVYEFGSSRVEILSPLKDRYDDLNEYSVVMKLTHGSNAFLFTGDMESYNENELLNADTDVSADVLKVAHHGSYTSSTESFLEAVGAEYGIISVGEDNDYGHPHNSVTRRLNAMMTVYRTDRHGTVTVTSDGSGLTAAAERQAQ